LPDGSSDSAEADFAQLDGDNRKNYSENASLSYYDSALPLAVGGIAGFLSDAAVNNYFAGKITVNGSETPAFDKYYMDNTSRENMYASLTATLKARDNTYSSPGYADSGVYDYRYSHSSSKYTGDSNIYYNTQFNLTLALGADFGVVANNVVDTENYSTTWGAYMVDRNYYMSDSPLSGVAVTGYLSHRRQQMLFDRPFTAYDDPDSAGYTQPFSSAEELADSLNGGLNDVGEVASVHLAGYSTNPETQERLLAYGATKLRTWSADGDLAVLSPVNESIPYLGYCKEETPIETKPLVPDTSDTIGAPSSGCRFFRPASSNAS
jgi:hypothetical protein